MKDTARLTVDMSSEEHKYLKMASASLGVSMREFMVSAAFEKMELLEDEWLAKKARDALKRFEKNEEELIPWETAKRKIARDDLRSKNRSKRPKVARKATKTRSK